MRKRIKLEKMRFGDCVVIERAKNKGHNTRYLCECDCGATFTVSSQQLREDMIDRCLECRKKKRRTEAIKKININAVKYTLMNRKKSEIIRGRNGIHSYFSKAKARLAARVIGNAVAVPLSEAVKLSKIG